LGISGEESEEGGGEALGLWGWLRSLELVRAPLVAGCCELVTEVQKIMAMSPWLCSILNVNGSACIVCQQLQCRVLMEIALYFYCLWAFIVTCKLPEPKIR